MALQKTARAIGKKIGKEAREELTAGIAKGAVMGGVGSGIKPKKTATKLKKATRVRKGASGTFNGKKNSNQKRY